jgi:hypothetical protein
MACSTVPAALDRIELLEKEVGVAAGTFRQLFVSTDDWTMVLKLHALLEAALARVIVHELGRPALEDFVDRLQMGQRRGNGRLALAVGLGLLDREDVQLLEGLGQLRNAYAHDPCNASKSLPALLDGLDANRRAEVERRLPALDVAPKDRQTGCRLRVLLAAVSVLAVLTFERERQLRRTDELHALVRAWTLTSAPPAPGDKPLSR